MTINKNNTDIRRERMNNNHRLSRFAPKNDL